MNKEKKFTKAEIEIVRFEKCDVIATSSDGPTGSTGPIWEEEEEGE